MMQARLDKKRIQRMFCSALITSDICVVFVAFASAYWFRFVSGRFPTPLGVPSFSHYLAPIACIAGLLVVIMNTYHLYRLDPTRKFVDQLGALVQSAGITMLFVLASTFFYRETSYSRSLIFLVAVNVALLLILSRYLLNYIYKRIILPRIKQRILIIGKPETVEIIKAHEYYFKGYGEIAGVVATRKSTSPYPPPFLLLGPLEALDEILDRVNPDEVILTDIEIPRKKIIALLLAAEKRMASFRIVADLLDIMIRQFEVENVDGLSMIKIKESPLNHVSNRILKRLLDLCGAGTGLILLSPVFVAIAFLVKLTSRGPVFFRQERVGEGGKTFSIYKFRTMCQDAESATGPVYAKRDDDRCTPIGKTLRRLNLDELPQLVNVLRGEMSLVGPRPERPHFVDQLKDDIPRYMSRHHVKAGLTGWAQINGLRQGTPIEERVKYDLYYLENWSLWFDIKIILLSVFALKNAY